MLITNRPIEPNVSRAAASSPVQSDRDEQFMSGVRDKWQSRIQGAGDLSQGASGAPLTTGELMELLRDLRELKVGGRGEDGAMARLIEDVRKAVVGDSVGLKNNGRASIAGDFAQVFGSAPVAPKAGTRIEDLGAADRNARANDPSVVDLSRAKEPMPVVQRVMANQSEQHAPLAQAPKIDSDVSSTPNRAIEPSSNTAATLKAQKDWDASVLAHQGMGMQWINNHWHLNGHKDRMDNE
jgi:hypothetical protein